MAFREAAIALAATLCGCTALPSSWRHADGQPISQLQLQADEQACHGELTKDTLASPNPPIGNEAIGYQAASIDIYRGCMADRGYLPQH